jgi:hypothetical protein
VLPNRPNKCQGLLRPAHRGTLPGVQEVPRQAAAHRRGAGTLRSRQTGAAKQVPAEHYAEHYAPHHERRSGVCPAPTGTHLATGRFGRSSLCRNRRTGSRGYIHRSKSTGRTRPTGAKRILGIVDGEAAVRPLVRPDPIKKSPAPLFHAAIEQGCGITSTKASRVRGGLSHGRREAPEGRPTHISRSAAFRGIIWDYLGTWHPAS